MSVADRIAAYLHGTLDTVSATAESCSEEIARAAAAVAESVRGGGKVLICGNGGSAADSQHLAAELVSTLTVDRRRPAIPARSR